MTDLVEKARAFCETHDLLWSQAYPLDTWLADFARSLDEWIPASTPPEEDGEYLVTMPVLDGKYSVTNDFFNVDRGEWQRYSGVTHWRPLPPPAK